MNTINPYQAAGPDGSVWDCAVFSINDTTDPFVISGVSDVNKQYTLSFWVKSDNESSVTAGGTTFTSSSVWKYCHTTFTATESDVAIRFTSDGTYYIYQIQLELGNIPTDWAPNPDDADAAMDKIHDQVDNCDKTIEQCNASIELLKDRLRMLVVDENGESMMSGSGDNWTFQFGERIGQVQNAFNQTIAELNSNQLSTDEAIAKLNDNLGDLASYVKIGKYTENDVVKPCIELGGNVNLDGDNNLFRLRLTNTSVVFFSNESAETVIDTDGVSTDNLTLNGEFRHTNPNAEGGHGTFVWAMRANGNYGLTWKED